MNSGESGLRGLEKQSRAPVAIRAANKEAKHYSGDVLGSIMKRFLIGIFGDTGTGKSFCPLSMLEDHVEGRSDEAEWIRTVFAHDPERAAKLLAADNKTRRQYLRAAHKIVFIDFDTMGIQPLIQSLTINKPLRRCIDYYPCTNWEEAFAAMKKGIASLVEHEKQWGKVGCWIVIDNMNRAWQKAQADWIYSLTGVEMNTMMADIRISSPGKNKEARKVQATQLAEKMDWSVINPMHNEEWIDIMVWTGYNIMFLSPPKQFEVEVGKQGGRPIKEKVNNLGGAKNNRHQMHYIWRKFVSEDGHTFYADLIKTRFTGIKGNEISNPTWRRMRMEMDRIEDDQLRAKVLRHAKFDYDDDLPSLDDIEGVDLDSTIIPEASIFEDISAEAFDAPPVPEIDINLDEGSFTGLANIALDDPEVDPELDIDLDMMDVAPAMTVMVDDDNNVTEIVSLDHLSLTASGIEKLDLPPNLIRGFEPSFILTDVPEGEENIELDIDFDTLIDSVDIGLPAAGFEKVSIAEDTESEALKEIALAVGGCSKCNERDDHTDEHHDAIINIVGILDDGTGADAEDIYEEMARLKIDEDVMDDMIYCGHLYEPSLAKIRLIDIKKEPLPEGGVDFEALMADIDIALPDLSVEDGDLDIVLTNDLSPEPADTPEPEAVEKTPSKAPITGSFVVSSKDKGKGKFHIDSCAVAKRLRHSEVVTDVGEREGCTKCIGTIAEAGLRGARQTPTKVASSDDDISLPEL